MLASQFGTALFSVAMVDDSMEISSEHGHNAGEDIDIDIDLTSGQVDEDYMLEDAASNASFGESFLPQPSPPLGNDDVMIDDDDESYPMADAELIHNDVEQNTGHEAVAMSFSGPDASQFTGEEPEDTAHLNADGLPQDAGLIWEAHDVQEQEVNKPNVKVQKSEEAIAYGDEEPFIDPDTKEAEESRELTANNNSQTTSPQNRSLPIATTDDQPGSPLAAVQEPGLGSPDQTSNHSDTEPLAVAVEDVKQTVDSTSLDDGNALRPAPEVIVVYQSIEYGLFSTSESDDPDSFFLSDVSITEKSLIDFFKAIREVIHEDLTDEEELCISVEELGLEIDEVSCTKVFPTQSTLTLTNQTSPSILDSTLGQIITLYERLLQNDRVESPRPLYVLLGTKANFSKRLANLTAVAAEGKGLSELVTWDEHSESPLEPIEPREGKQGDDSALENYEADEDYGDTYDGTNDEEIEVSIADPSTQPIGDHDQLSESGDVQKSTATASPSSAPETSEAQHIGASDSPTLPTTQISTSGEYDEDGDLIDYSDEEFEDENKQQRGDSGPTELETDVGRTHNGTFADFVSPCLKPNTCFCSKCNDLLLAEYEAINEELRRRSISRAAEDSAVGQPTDGVENDHDVQPSRSQAETGVEYDEDESEGEELEHEEADAEYEDSSADDGESYDAVEVERRGDIHFDLGGDGEFEGDDLISDARGGSGAREDTYGDDNGNDAFEDEVESGEGDDNQTQNLPRLGGKETFPRDATSMSSSLGFADAAESSATTSADEIRFEEGLGKQIASDSKENYEPNISNDGTNDAGHEDEIDYEDDERQESLQAQEELHKSEDSTMTNGGLRKRPRAEDADLDEGMTTRSKGVYTPASHFEKNLLTPPLDTKRPRS
jgi:hypothetical protein